MILTHPLLWRDMKFLTSALVRSLKPYDISREHGAFFYKKTQKCRTLFRPRKTCAVTAKCLTTPSWAVTRSPKRPQWSATVSPRRTTTCTSAEGPERAQLPSSAWAPPVCLLRLVRCWISDWRRSSVGIFTCVFSCQSSCNLLSDKRCPHPLLISKSSVISTVSIHYPLQVGET